MLTKKHWWHWQLKELTAKQTPKQIYNTMARQQHYDDVIHYQQRVNNYSSAIKQLTLANQAKVLDLACGTGAFIEGTLQVLPQAHITGIDIAKEMLHIAQQRFKSCPQVTLQHNDFMQAHLDPTQFDLITLGISARFIMTGQLPQFIKLTKSWLKPNGYFIITASRGAVFEMISTCLRLLGFRHGLAAKLHWQRHCLASFGNDYTVRKVMTIHEGSLLKNVAIILQK